MKHKSTWALAMLAATIIIPASALAQTTLKIGWTSSGNSDDPYASAAHAFGEAVEARTAGNVVLQYYPNRQLGDEKQMLEGLRFGTVDAAVITNAVVGQLESAFELNDLPFLYADAKQAHEVLDGPVGEELAQRLDKKGIVVLGFTEGGFRYMLNNTRPVSVPSDVQGVKYRVMQNPVFIDMFDALGGSAIPMAWGETFTAVQQGTIDGLELPLAVAAGNKLHEVTKFLSLTGHTYSTNLLLLSKRAFNKLTPEQREHVLAAGKEATAIQREKSAEDHARLLATLEQNGMVVNAIPDTAPFREAVAPIYDKYKPRIGADLLDQVLSITR